jgi:hypothetical protein
MRFIIVIKKFEVVVTNFGGVSTLCECKLRRVSRRNEQFPSITITILDIIHRPIFRTSQETHYASATSPEG